MSDARRSALVAGCRPPLLDTEEPLGNCYDEILFKVSSHLSSLPSAPSMHAQAPRPCPPGHPLPLQRQPLHFITRFSL